MYVRLHACMHTCIHICIQVCHACISCMYACKLKGGLKSKGVFMFLVAGMYVCSRGIGRRVYLCACMGPNVHRLKTNLRNCRNMCKQEPVIH